MNAHPLDYALLADENIHADVIATLKSRGYDIVSVADAALYGKPDLDLLQYSCIY